MPQIVRIRVPTYEDMDVGAGPITLYPVEVTYDTGKSRKVSKRYSDVLNFHTTLLKAAPHVALETFNFPHKSLFSTSAEFTKERRRSGFEEYFELLLRLGTAYAPFVATFLRHGEFKDEVPSFEELGASVRPPGDFRDFSVGKKGTDTCMPRSPRTRPPRSRRRSASTPSSSTRSTTPQRRSRASSSSGRRRPSTGSSASTCRRPSSPTPTPSS